MAMTKLQNPGSKTTRRHDQQLWPGKGTAPSASPSTLPTWPAMGGPMMPVRPGCDRLGAAEPKHADCFDICSVCPALRLDVR